MLMNQPFRSDQPQRTYAGMIPRQGTHWLFTHFSNLPEKEIHIDCPLSPGSGGTYQFKLQRGHTSSGDKRVLAEA